MPETFPDLLARHMAEAGITPDDLWIWVDDSRVDAAAIEALLRGESLPWLDGEAFYQLGAALHDIGPATDPDELYRSYLSTPPQRKEAASA